MTTLYETDFVGWAERQVHLLRAEEFESVDWAHLIEEIEGLGISQQNELRNRLKVLIMHLLKYQFQPERRSRSWQVTIVDQRIEIADLLEMNPSLRPRFAIFVASVYPVAVKRAANETGLPRSTFPSESPYSVDQLMDDEFFAL